MLPSDILSKMLWAKVHLLHQTLACNPVYEMMKIPKQCEQIMMSEVLIPRICGPQQDRGFVQDKIFFILFHCTAKKLVFAYILEKSKCGLQGKIHFDNTHWLCIDMLII